MIDILLERIRAAAPNFPILTRAETFLLKAYLDRYPAPHLWYETDYDAQQRIGSVGEYTDPEDEALWIHLRATLEYSQAEVERVASNEQQPAPTAPTEPQHAPGSEQDSMRYIEAIGDDTALKIDAIARRKDLKGEDKMRLIVKLDDRFRGKDSNEWATLLSVSPAAIRGYAFWKELRGSDKMFD